MKFEQSIKKINVLSERWYSFNYWTTSNLLKKSKYLREIWDIEEMIDVPIEGWYRFDYRNKLGFYT